MSFLAGRAGSYVGGKAFNSSVSSCDGVNQNGQLCCFDKKEAHKRQIPVCVPTVQQINPTPVIDQLAKQPGYEWMKK